METLSKISVNNLKLLHEVQLQYCVMLQISGIVCDHLDHLGHKDLHVPGPLHAPLDHLLVVGVDASVVLHHAHVGDQATGKHLRQKKLFSDGMLICFIPLFRNGEPQ